MDWMSSKDAKKSMRNASTPTTVRIVPSGRQQFLVAAGAALAGVIAGVAAASSRRAAVEVAESMTGDWLDALTAEHLVIIELFDRLEGTKAENAARRRKLLQRLRFAIEKHAFAEETVIYPAARALGPDMEKAVADLVASQADIKFMLYQLDHADAADAEWTATAEKLRDTFEKHVMAEEEQVFPVLRDKLGPREETELTTLLYRTGSKLA